MTATKPSPIPERIPLQTTTESRGFARGGQENPSHVLVTVSSYQWIVYLIAPRYLLPRLETSNTCKINNPLCRCRLKANKQPGETSNSKSEGHRGLQTVMVPPIGEQPMNRASLPPKTCEKRRNRVSMLLTVSFHNKPRETTSLNRNYLGPCPVPAVSHKTSHTGRSTGFPLTLPLGHRSYSELFLNFSPVLKFPY